jgi:polyadenylation factor subunit 2
MTVNVLFSFSPSDTKFVTCSDDGTLRIWDFFRYQEERILRGKTTDLEDNCIYEHYINCTS